MVSNPSLLFVSREALSWNVKPPRVIYTCREDESLYVAGSSICMCDKQNEGSEMTLETWQSLRVSMSAPLQLQAISEPIYAKAGGYFWDSWRTGVLCVCVWAQREVFLDSSASIFQFENIYMGLSFKRICFFRWKELVWDWVRQTEKGKMDNAGTNAENKGFLLLSGISKVHFHVSMILEWHLRNARELTLTFNNLNNSLHFQKGLTSRRNTIHFPA